MLDATTFWRALNRSIYRSMLLVRPSNMARLQQQLQIGWPGSCSRECRHWQCWTPPLSGGRSTDPYIAQCCWSGRLTWHDYNSNCDAIQDQAENSLIRADCGREGRQIRDTADCLTVRRRRRFGTVGVEDCRMAQGGEGVPVGPYSGRAKPTPWCGSSPAGPWRGLPDPWPPHCRTEPGAPRFAVPACIVAEVPAFAEIHPRTRCGANRFQWREVPLGCS